MTAPIPEWQEVACLFDKLTQEEQAIAKRIHDKLLAAVRNGSKTPYADALIGEDADLRDALIALDWGATGQGAQRE